MKRTSFWKVTMNRSVKLSKSYFILGIVVSIYGIILSNLMSIIPADPADAASTSIEMLNSFPILSVALISLSAVFFALPVVMLFVYDKNNGVIEYLLSTGLDQLDIFKGYTKASLLLATYLLVFSNILNTAIGILFQTSWSMLASMVILSFAIGIAEVFLVTVSMMAFSSLQKTPTGANQPLGVVIGVVPMFPALILPMIFPAYAIIIDVLIAAVVLAISLVLLLSISRLIMRERLLP